MVKIRIVIGVMLFMACFTSYVMRTNMSIILPAMVENKNLSVIEPDYGPRFNWSEFIQAKILSIFYVGFVITTLFGGTIAEKVGGRLTIGYITFIGGILTMLHPVFAGGWQSYPIKVLRFFSGAAAGFCLPACHTLISKWAPPDEKGKFVATLIGGSFGTVVTFQVSGLIIEHFDWIMAFYVEGMFCVMFSILWFVFVTDDPKDHWLIKQEEAQYIRESIAEIVTNNNKGPPICSIFTSIPVYALTLLHFGNVWNLTLVLIDGPKYLHESFHYTITKTGLLTSLPIIVRGISACIFGVIADLIRSRKILSVTKTRKIFCLTSHIIPGLLLFALGVWETQVWLNILLMTLSLGFNGSSAITNLQNPQDLAPNFAGTIFSLIEFFGTMSGFIVPIVVGFYTKENSSHKEWRNVFFIGGIIYIVPAIIFIVLGTGQIQKWNFPKDENVSVENVPVIR